MVQNKDVDFAFSEDIVKKEENGLGQHEIQNCKQQSTSSIFDEDYLGFLTFVPPIKRDETERYRKLVSGWMHDFCFALESRKEYPKIREELHLDFVKVEDADKDAQQLKEIIDEDPKVLSDSNEETPVEKKIETTFNELRRQSIRLKKAQFVPEHAPAINDQFFVCRRCTIFFQTRKLRKLHNIEYHRRKKIDTGNTHTDKIKKRQRRSSSNKEPFICDFCAKTFQQKALLRSHMNIHMSEPQYFCSLCPYASKRNNDLKKHHETHHNPERIIKRIRRRQCEKCKEVFDGKKAYKQHLREKHPLEQNARKIRNTRACEICNEIFDGIRTYRLHLKQNHREMAAVIRCDICHRKFKTNFRLKKHKLKYAESGLDCRTYFRLNLNDNHECTQCEKKFPLKSHLTLHMKKHVNLTCEKCNQTFKNKFNLKWHEFSHLEIEPKCSNCLIGFKSEQKFAVHLKKKMCINSPEVGECTG